MYETGMNLPQGDERPCLLIATRAELLQECLSVAFDCVARVLLGKSEIECAPPINAGESGGSCAESMNQPWNGSETFRLENIYPFIGEILWHYNILEQATLLKIMLRPNLDVVCARWWPVRTHTRAVELYLHARAGR